jgi:hypothetical protein
VKPRPALARRLYLMVGHCTTGRSLSTGRGATAAALARRASRRRCLRPGYQTFNVSFFGPFFHKKSLQSRRHRKDHCRIFSWMRTWSKCTRTRRCQSLWKSNHHDIRQNQVFFFFSILIPSSFPATIFFQSISFFLEIQISIDASRQRGPGLRNSRVLGITLLCLIAY